MARDLAAAFTGNLPLFYDTYLVPMQFMPYAHLVAEKAREFAPRSILETAAGTGIVTTPCWLRHASVQAWKP